MEINKVSITYDVKFDEDVLLRGEVEILPDNTIIRFFGLVNYKDNSEMICAFEYTNIKPIELFASMDESLRNITLEKANYLLNEFKTNPTLYFY